MKLAIADPPYLGRADRWYGDGRGSGRTATVAGRNGRKPDHHPQAAEWDDPERHVQLVRDLAQYDGWLVAGAPGTERVLLEAAPADAQLGIWHRPNAMPGGGRVLRSYEPVVFRVPEGRRDRSTGPRVRDVLSSPVLPQGFLGSKPPAWTRWALELLGYQPSDELVDIFPGSGAVAAAADGRLDFTEDEVRRYERDYADLKATDSQETS